MKKFEEIRDEVIKERYNLTYLQAAHHVLNSHELVILDADIAKRYATEAIKADRERVLKEIPDIELTYIDFHDFSKGIDWQDNKSRESILNLPIELP